MKVNIINNGDYFIENFDNVEVTDIAKLDDNCCFELHCDTHILKLVKNKSFSDFIRLLVSKLRRGGMVCISGVDMCSVTMSYVYKDINEEKLSELLSNSAGFYNCKMVEQELIANNLRIDSMNIKNNIFVVRAVRD